MTHSAIHRLTGFSIVELLVSVALTSVLLVGVAAIFSSSRASYAATDRLSQVQESGRLALYEIQREIRSAGFRGCVQTATAATSTLNRSDDIRWDFLAAPVRGFQASGTGAREATLATSVAPDALSDVLVVHGPARNAASLRLLASMKSATDPLRIAATEASGLHTGDIALIFSCEAQTYFQVTGVDNGEISHTVTSTTDPAPGNAAESLGFAFREGAQVLPVQTVVYYVAADPVGIHSTALWRRIGAGDAQKLVEGVEQMELQFGVDSSGDNAGRHYVTADEVTDWNAVSSVAVALLVRSLDQASSGGAEPITYQLLDVTATVAGDRRTREVFTGLSGIRNRPMDAHGVLNER